MELSRLMGLVLEGIAPCDSTNLNEWYQDTAQVCFQALPSQAPRLVLHFFSKDLVQLRPC